ncbi:MAG: hypothetical protein ABI612_21630, partial [Betaproteobacteria bacterium]
MLIIQSFAQRLSAKTLSVFVVTVAVVATMPFGYSLAAPREDKRSPVDNKTHRERMGTTSPANPENSVLPPPLLPGRGRYTEAPAGFDNVTNGFLPQGPDFITINANNVVAGRSFNDNRFIFEEVEGIADGLGPTYNAQSCRECHQNIVTGGASQIAEHRAGRESDGEFFESQGGSLVESRAIHPDIIERQSIEDSLHTFRISTSILGGGYVEAISNSTLLAIRDRQPEAMRGYAVMVPSLEA